MSLCVVAGAKTLVIAAEMFTLAWTHSIEKVEWEETWHVAEAGLTLVQARVKGSGAGMEPPDGSTLQDGWWVYRPDLPRQASVVLAASGETPSGWRLCAREDCIVLGEAASDPIELRPCEN